MSRYLLTLIILCIYSLATAQNSDITIDANKKEVVTSNDAFKSNSIESLTNYFYGNIGNIKKIDKIISYKFYQATPYKDFSKLMESKNVQFGKFISKEVVKIEYSDHRNKATVFLRVKYSNIESNEQIVFFKESAKEGYNIVEYKIQ